MSFIMNDLFILAWKLAFSLIKADMKQWRKYDQHRGQLRPAMGNTAEEN